MSGNQPTTGNPGGSQTTTVGRSPFGFVRTLEAAAADNSPHLENAWEIILHIQENLVMHDGRVAALASLKIWDNQYDGFAAHAYSWLRVHHESNTSEAAIAGISHTRPRLKEQISESLATHERANRPRNQEKGEVDQSFPDTIESEADFWSQEAIAKSLNNTTPSLSQIADIPRTSEEHATYIREMFDALKNTEGILEKATNIKVEIVKSTSGRVFLDIAWVLLREAKTFQLGKPNVKPWCTTFIYEQYPTMRARWNDMVGFFNTSKAAVANLIVAHNEKRFAGNPKGEKSRKVQNDKTNKGKATKIQTNRDKATTLDQMVNRAEGRARARRATASLQNGKLADQKLHENGADDVLDDEERARRQEAEAAEPNSNDEHFADSDEEANKDEVQAATGREEIHEGDVNEYDAQEFYFQEEQVLAHPPPVLGVNAGSSHTHPSANFPFSNSLTGRQQRVRNTAGNEGNPSTSSIAPAGDLTTYPPVNPSGLNTPNLHPSYRRYLMSNSNNGSVTLPDYSMGYSGPLPDFSIPWGFAQFPSGNASMTEPQVAGDGNTAVGIGRPHPTLSNTDTSSAGGGSQSSAGGSRLATRRGRNSLEDDSEADVEAHPMRRYRF
ncbi:hypothetical protein B0T20DRAFT_349755 [Sordaria brevicollis]|uniref:Uncharacterized protein n=1 Tax=Sordaria brevicollis TaxID=83679 RepID=A0AAE0UDD3_SORBR|nr:hypothetical protein B0T20DRAFT_349755 [Sordaria brevicollis]